ncbi:NYN domain-containing protein [Oerskovia sp. Sa1BUA8]|uniref:NYN domain-containing protein n=1 Tax=Oerskovia douganii TaxID=2762210 RepID=A0A9D5UE38_9CELL|nr:PIN domain-containing protein [Oerskovia douganii]MBE7702316.1 NYN domain-containing protein [Oerskovia douganii]
MDTEERLAVFLDYDNLALGARDHLGGMTFDFKPIADALAARGRVVVRRAYADWSYFDEDRRSLTRHQVELIEMPQRMGASRKNAADIKMVVDAIEMAFEREYISTFVMCTGDSDFSPLVHKLRELNKRVIGIGVENSTSKLLPPACDEFLFYDRLEGVEIPDEPVERKRSSNSSNRSTTRKSSGRSSGSSGKAATAPAPEAATPPASPASPAEAAQAETEPTPVPLDVEAELGSAVGHGASSTNEDEDLAVLVAQTLADLSSSSSGAVVASTLKRTLLRKDPTFSEADYGFRNFGEFLRYLEERGVVQLSAGPATGDPEVSLPERGHAGDDFALLRTVVGDQGGSVPLSGLKNQLRKKRPDFSEKALGYRSFLQFCKAAQTAGAIDLRWDDDADDYLVSVAAR